MEKICVTSVGPDIDSLIDPRFGRCAYFLIIGDKGKLIKAIPNAGVRAMRGVGVSAAQIVANEKVKTVITGNVGPNACMVLNSSKIKIFISAFGISAKQAIQMYKDGKLKEIKSSQGLGFRPGFGPGNGQGMRGGGLGRGRRRR